MTDHPLADLIQQQTGHSIDQLLAPISNEHPAGESLRYSELYTQINQARTQDDPSIPRGEWETELKQANWQQVVTLCADGLANQSKDLQLAVWLLEAQMHRFGMDGLAPGLLLIDQLCHQFWQPLHPQQDMEYRNNIISWASNTLQPLLYTLSLTACGEEEICWEDLETANRNEQILAANPREQVEGATINQCQHALSGTDTQHLVSMFEALEAGFIVLEQLMQSLDTLMEDDAPSLTGLFQLLEQMGHFLYGELQKRGFSFEQPQQPLPAEPVSEDAAPSSVPTPAAAGPNRAEAYAQLSEIADYLAHIEPHSPVPCLLRRMVEWGNMSTSELYQQLFITGQGKINVFEVLGLEKNAA